MTTAPEQSNDEVQNPVPLFSPEHAQYLEERAVNLELAARCGLQTIDAPTANYALGRTDLPAFGKYLLVPYPSGARVRVIPKLNGLGKDLAPRSDFAPNPDVFPLDDGKGPLHVVESAPKALALYSHGLRAVGLAGVSSGLVKGKAELNLHWAILQSLKGREVIILFDSNSDKAAVAEAETRLAKAIRREGATVRVARLPKADDGADQGPDDFLARHGSEALKEVLQNAHEPKEPTDEKKAWRTAQEIFDDESIPDTSWLWQDVIPAGELTVLGGTGGVGKTTLLSEVAARLSRGESIPRGMEKTETGTLHPTFLAANPGGDVQPLNVGILRSEVKPKAMTHKLRVAGADMGRIIVREDAQIRLPTDWPVVEGLIREKKLGLLVVDAVADFSADLDPNSAKDVRSLLSPAVGMAQRTGCAIVAVKHFKKSEDSMSGSHEWRDVPRSAVAIKALAAPHTSRVWLSKGSDADDSVPVVDYRTVSEPVPGKTNKWGLRIEVVADEGTKGPSLYGTEKTVAEVLEKVLQGQGWQASAEVIKEVREEVGATENVIKKVRYKLGLPVQKSDGNKTEWSWPE